jgi:hypothetical protein
MSVTLMLMLMSLMMTALIPPAATFYLLDPIDDYILKENPIDFNLHENNRILVLAMSYFGLANR